MFFVSLVVNVSSPSLTHKFVQYPSYTDNVERFSEFRGSPDMMSSLGALSGHPVQPTEYSPSPRKYHVASRSHSPAGDRLVDSMLGKDTDNVSTVHVCVLDLFCPHPHTPCSIQHESVRSLWMRMWMYMYVYCRRVSILDYKLRLFPMFAFN